MAVSFKVPASPKKSIFVIDEFQGVDLTNTGSNIDEHKSPNAENMIRYVPGKVRKRMGYSVPVEFGDGTDINRVANTSDEWVRLTNAVTHFPLVYSSNERIGHYYLKVQIKAVGTFNICRGCHDGTVFYVTRSGTEEQPYDYTHYQFDITDAADHGGLDEIKVELTSSGANDYIEIRRMFVCAKTSVTTASDFWPNDTVPWKPAPEDNGKSYVIMPQTDAVYGRHVLKTGKKEGDFVTDVNRALNTSSVFQTFADKIICALGEDIPRNKRVHIAFDYEDANNTQIIAGYDPVFNVYTDTVTTITGNGRYSGYYTATNDTAYFTISDTTTKIKNFMVTYAIDTNRWSKAPEDDGAEFDVGNVYQKTGDNTAVATTQTGIGYHIATDPASDTILVEVNIQQATTAVVGKLTIIEFDVSLSANKATGGSVMTPVNIDSYSAEYVKSDNNEVPLWFKTTTADNDHYVFYLRPTSNIYIKDLQFRVKLAETLSTFGTCEAAVKNLTVYEGIESTDFYSSAYINLYHVGRRLYANKSATAMYNLIYSDMNQQRSISWQFEAHDNESAALGYDNLYIVDGKTFLEFNGARETVEEVYGNGKIPLITYAKEPSGGGKSYYAVNRLQPGFEEQFIGNGSDTVFQLSFNDLDSTPVRVWVKDRDDGVWFEKTEGTDFTVLYGQGSVRFVNAPWDATQIGEDNVRIRAYRTVNRYKSSINKCSFGTLFGVNGTSDRLFLSGNPDTPNYDYFSEQYDPTYFPDINYGTLGVSSSAIKGYARVNNYLATFKDENEPSQSVFIREGDWIVDSETNNGEPAFKLINTLQGNGAISPYTFGYLQTEPLFLTKSGIYAITAQDITGEKYGQSRSFYLNGGLLKEDNLDNSCAIVYNDQYILAINGHLYVLDGLQPTRTDPQAPYATRQYVGFYCTNINAVTMWTYEDALWFGSHDGKVCKFYTDTEDIMSYNDDGDPIYCCWETPDLSGKLFYKNKTFRYFAIRMMKALRTSVTLYSKKLGTWGAPIKEDTQTGLAFDFGNIDFERFTFSTDRSEKVVHAKIRVKKVDKAAFKVENKALNEPFGLFDWALEYIESGNYKG